MWFKRAMPYTQDEISEQIGQIADLMKMRTRAAGNNEVLRFTNAIAISQEVLAFMLDENIIRQGRKHERAV